MGVEGSVTGSIPYLGMWVSWYLGVWDRDIIRSLVVGVMGVISLESCKWS